MALVGAHSEAAINLLRVLADDNDANQDVVREAGGIPPRVALLATGDIPPLVALMAFGSKNAKQAAGALCEQHAAP